MILLQDATIVTAEKVGKGSILICEDKIKEVWWAESEDYSFRVDMLKSKHPEAQVHDLTGKHVIAGGIDAHVHFRDPGLTHKADMATESRAAAAGGVTTVFDMPNTKPATTQAVHIAEKLALAKERSVVNMGFHIGATNENAAQIAALVKNGDAETGVKPSDIAGVKVFMGSSTGNMLVDAESTLAELFSISEKPVLVHCEDEEIIRRNTEKAVETYGDEIPFSEHENIRSRMACIRSSIKALELAIKYNTRLTLCHISTKEEIEMVRAAKLNNPAIVAETSCNYLWFSNEDYAILGSKVKCNPSVKTPADRQALRTALSEGLIDTIGSDHAPHLLSEKDAPYTKAPSGLPSIQQTLPVLLTIAQQEEIPLEKIASVFSEKAAEIYELNRGKIQAGWQADLVVFDYGKEFTVKAEDQKSKCGWSPYEGQTLKGVIEAVYINGKQVNL
ncbi:MAG: dihydroorotase [Bacteroidales bacterium]|nr:dihydroorotase [Bacteroidales bacterium]